MSYQRLGDDVRKEVVVMPISFDRKKKMFHLSTPSMSYVFGLRGEYILEHLYYGKKLASLDGLFSPNYGEYVHGASVDVEYEDAESFTSTDVVLQEYGFYGSCDLRTPAFHAVYNDGNRITKMRYLSHQIIDGKPKLPGLPSTYTECNDEAQTLEITIRDELTGLFIIHRYTVFAHLDVMTRSVEVVNEGKSSVAIDKVMSASMDFEDNDFDFIHFHGAWGRESYPERVPLMKGCVKIESRRGASSHDHRPFFILARKNADEEQGEVYGFSLLYSGNFEAGVEVERYNSARAFIGINSFDFSWLLEPGERFVTPEVVMVYSANGIGEMSRTYHKLFRTRLARGNWRDKKRPVLINNWEATYFDFDEEKIVDIARIAKKTGIELLVLDDGWFGTRNDDTSSLGDWYANLKKLPGGIRGVAEKVHEEGLLFGLWFEPEMVSPDSDLYRAHPDWCLHVKGRGRSCSRNQLVLDFSREDVREYIVSVMSEILSDAPIDYIKWDMNRNMSEIGSAILSADRQAETAHRYMLGVYEVLETMKTRFPEILLEGCSAGGGRFDAGMMYYFDQYWTSDNSDAGERMYIQHGTSYQMPAVFMGAHVSAVPNHQVSRMTSLETRGLVAMSGQFGYELDITKMSEEELEQIAEQIKDYKDIRMIIHNGSLYRLKSPFDSNHTVWQYISEDKKTVVVFYFKIKAVVGFERNRLKLSGLCDDAYYSLEGTEQMFRGEVLNNYGFCAEEMGGPSAKKLKDYSGKMFVFRKVRCDEN